MNVINIVNDFICGIYYAKNSILYYKARNGKCKKVKTSKAEYEYLKSLSLDIEKRNKRYKRFDYAYPLILLIIFVMAFFINNVVVFYTNGVNFDNYIKIKTNNTIVYENYEDTRMYLINAIKADYPGIKLNEKEISTILIDNPNDDWGAMYFTDTFNSSVILLYDDLIDYQSHEFIHHLSNTGFYIGWQNRVTNKGVALNEGMTEYIKLKYMPSTALTYREKYYIDSLVKIFGEEILIRSYFNGSTKEISKLLNKYSDGYDLLKEIDDDHLVYNNTKVIEEHIVEIFITYLEENKNTIPNYNAYVNNFINSIGRNIDSSDAKILYNRIIEDALVMNDNYVPHIAFAL